jgi:hypothetical protein
VKRRAPFKQADVSRALRAVDKAGLKIARVDVESSGKFSIVVADGAAIGAANSFDIWKAKYDAREEASSKFLGLAARTRADYAKQIRVIEEKLGDFQLDDLADRRTRGAFQAWRDGLAAGSKGQGSGARPITPTPFSLSFSPGRAIAG